MVQEPVNQIRREHGTIENLLNLLDKVADRLDTRQTIAIDLFPDLLEFLRAYVDTCHQTKEERVLFVALEDHGVAHDSGPISVLLNEHELGRRHVNTLAESARHYVEGAQGSAQALAQVARGYASLFREHMQKEDTILLPMVATLLSADELAAMSAKFEQVEQEHLGIGERERLEKTLIHLENELTT